MRLPSRKHIIPPIQRHVPSRHWLLAIFAESSGGLARNPETARELIAEFEDLCNRLEKMDETGEISTHDHAVHLELMSKAVRNAVPESVVSEEVAKMAKGQILKLAVADRLKAAENYGRREGLRAGKEEGWRAVQKDTSLGLVRDGFITPAAGAARLDMDE